MKNFIKENVNIVHIIIYLFLIIIRFNYFTDIINYLKLLNNNIYWGIDLVTSPYIFFLIFGFLIRKNLFKDGTNIYTYLLSVILCSSILLLIIIVFWFIGISLKIILPDYKVPLYYYLIDFSVRLIFFPFLMLLYGVFSIGILKINGDYKIKEALYVFKKPILKKAFTLAFFTYLIPFIFKINIIIHDNNYILKLILFFVDYISILVNFYFIMYLVSYLKNNYSLDSKIITKQ